MAMRSAIVLFARSPEREAAAKGLPVSTVPLFRAVIAAWLETAERHGATALIACAAEDRPAFAPDLEWIEQRGDSFGARVANAASAAFARFDAVLIAAIDAPPPADLSRAFEALAEGIAVVGPARDGGVNFLGLTSPDVELLTRLAPRRSDLVRVCREHFRELLVLGSATDVDSVASLAQARRDVAWRGYFGVIALPRVVWAFGLPPVIPPEIASRPPPAR
jgi:glycosyltransferase A (GT-A) superfamily protein (DUF2064 family)